jgi:small subunit ribosomal protein S3
MGQKIHPVGMRLGITRTWDSRWFENKQYANWLHEDRTMRDLIEGMSRSAAVSKVEIERRANTVRVIVHTGKPGIIIGKRGAGIDDLKKKLEKIAAGKQVQVNVVEIKHPEMDAKLVANNIVDQLEKRIAFRRAMRQALQRTTKAGARGIKVQCGGRLGGAEIARVERTFEGKVPLHTLRADIDYAHSEAYTTFGRIGVKVWIYKGEVLPDGRPKPDARDQRPVRRVRPVRAARPLGAPAPGAVAAPVAGTTPAASLVPGTAAAPATTVAPAVSVVPTLVVGQPEPTADVPTPEASTTSVAPTLVVGQPEPTADVPTPEASTTSVVPTLVVGQPKPTASSSSPIPDPSGTGVPSAAAEAKVVESPDVDHAAGTSEPQTPEPEITEGT